MTHVSQQAAQEPPPIVTARNTAAPLSLILPTGAILYAALTGWTGLFGTATKVFVALALVNIIHTLGCALFARMLGAQLEEIALGMGHCVVSKEVGGTTLSLRSFPAGGFVRAAGMGYEETGSAKDFHCLPLFNRILVMASGCLSVMLFACALIGPRAASASFLSALPQFFELWCFPLTRGQDILSHFAEAARTATWPVLLASAGAKTAAYNLLPVPTLNGGAILMEIFRAHLPAERSQKVLTAGFAVLLLLFLTMLFALTRFFWDAFRP